MGHSNKPAEVLSCSGCNRHLLLTRSYSYSICSILFLKNHPKNDVEKGRTEEPVNLNLWLPFCPLILRYTQISLIWNSSAFHPHNSINQGILHQNKLIGMREHDEDQAIEVDKLENKLK